MKYYIFNRQGELAATADVAPNMEDLSARGEQAIESEFEFVNPIFSNGEIIERGIAPTHYHTWNGMGWEIDKMQQQAVISAEKSAKLAEINRQAQAFVNELARIDDTPEFERETWPIQREESKAWQIDPHAPTPTIALIAQLRGVPLDVLRQKAFEKAMAYQTVAAVVAGQRQAYEDRLNRAETLEAVQDIKPVYQLPMNEEEEDVQNDES